MGEGYFGGGYWIFYFVEININNYVKCDQQLIMVVWSPKIIKFCVAIAWLQVFSRA